MVLPESVTVSGFIIPVRLVKNLYSEHACYGLFRSIEMVIDIDESLSEDKKEVIFVHEWIEAVKDIYLLDMEEHEIQILAVTIRCLLKNGEVNFNV